jgi:hypothetical protein
VTAKPAVFAAAGRESNRQRQEKDAQDKKEKNPHIRM